MRIAERLPVIADDDDERVLIEAGAADAVEQPPEMPVGFVEDVQISVQVVVVGHRLADEIEQRDAGRRLVGMVRLLRPRP